MTDKNLVTNLQKMAAKIQESFWLRQIFFLIATCLTIIIIGYYFGTFDQSIHIPFLKKFANPSLYPNDTLLALRFTHYSFFWYPFIFFLNQGLLEPAVFVVHVLSIYLTYSAIWALSLRLFRNPLTAVFSVLAFIIPHVGFTGFSVFEFSLLNRTFALPFLLWVFSWYLSGRHYKAFLLLGLMYNIHALSGNFVLAILGIDVLFQFRSLRRGLICLFSFCIGALPVLLWRFIIFPTSSVSIDREWFSLISNGVLYHIFHPFGPYLHILLSTFSGLSAVAMLFVLMSKYPAKSLSNHKTIKNSIVAILGILLINEFFIRFFPLTFVVQSQLSRIGIFILIFFYLYAANYITILWQTPSSMNVDRFITTISILGTPIPLVPAIIYALRLIIHRPVQRVILSTVFLILSTSALIFLIHSWGIWSPEVHIYGKNTPWKQTQLWAKEHTEPSALFLTPPQIWWFYESDWRVFSERSSMVTLTELLEIAFTPSAIGSWKDRFNDVMPGVYTQFRGNYYDNVSLTKHAYANLTLERIKNLAKKYGISYMVVEHPTIYPLPVVYQNSQFSIYTIVQ